MHVKFGVKIETVSLIAYLLCKKGLSELYIYIYPFNPGGENDSLAKKRSNLHYIYI